ncbi:MAG: cellulase family glycosylhydrolase [Opitutaceae bacterium]|nr:cellulase family glycosylhydrolase [Opitutaceae bacterium]
MSSIAGIARSRSFALRVAGITAVLALLSVRLTGAPVAFEFALQDDSASGTALAREIFADVVAPDGTTVRLPAFVSGPGRWTVHARADQSGEFRLGHVGEWVDGTERELAARPASAATRTVAHPQGRPAIVRPADDPTRLALADGAIYTPIGANLAWTTGERVRWHEEAFREFATHGLNWTRIWMCHWGAMNLDWLPEDMGPSPAPGQVDPRIAHNWDRVLAAAERHGIYVQLVLQHHGQYSSTVNSNWASNPWNAAHPGGFLRSPGEFFTSPRAIALTKQKYRYIVARWSHSPAILAWELFNEVHWTDAYRHERDEAAVAAWHAEMAAYLRAIDPYHHLITTSLEDLRSPIYAAMDYLQPHLYAINMLTGVREFEQPFDSLDRPIFYGEIGDDKLALTPEEKSAGSGLVPQVWASLMGPGPSPAQSWLGEAFLRTGRVGELGAVARFLRETGLATRAGLVPFSPAVSGPGTRPLRIIPGYDWATHRSATETIPLDGSDSLAANHVPGILVGNPRSIAEGYLAEFTLHLDMPRDTDATIAFADGGARGAAASILVDGREVASHRWARLPGTSEDGPQPPDTPERPAALSFPLTAGRHAITIRNTGGADWIRLGHIDLGIESPVIAAAGKRGTDFIALWAWNKRGVHAATPANPATATLLLEDVPAGTWMVTWWDADRGVPQPSDRIDHAGGTLRLATPAIARHAAVTLIR